MSSFTSELKVSPINDSKWSVLESFVYYIGEKGSRDFVEVPPGFVTDFASIPRILWTILPPWGKYGKAAVVHDYLYTAHSRKQVTETDKIDVPVTRSEADRIFLEAMEVLGVNKFTRYSMYYAVRIFGNKPWSD